MTNSLNDTTFPFNSYGEDFVLSFRVQRYTNDRLCLETWIEQDFGPEPFAKVTVNMPDDHLNEGEVFIKDWAENAPLVEALVQAGWLIPTGREVVSGYIAPAVMRLGGPLEVLSDFTLGPVSTFGEDQGPF